MTPLPARGLYAITDTALTASRGVVACARDAIAGGAVALQYRDKSDDRRRRAREAAELLALCREHGVAFVVNDDVALARTVGADGVHVGRDDAAVRAARDVLGDEPIVGASCYHDLELAVCAQRDGASYVAFGRFFPSRTKPGRPLATPDLLGRAREQVALPRAAIGGITAANAPALVAAGADLLAVIHDLFGAGDVRARARALAASFD